MGDEHLNTIPATESDEFIKSCVENLVQNPSESEGENGCDVPACFTTFSNILFDADYELDSVDDQSCSNEDVPEKIFSNPLFEEEIISTKIDPHHFNPESDLIESMLNHDSSIIPSSSKIDSLLDEFTGELTLLKLISPGVDETDCHPEKEIRLTKRFLYDNSSPRPPKEFVIENSNANIESFSPSHIPVKDSNFFMKEIDLSFNSNDPMPPSIEEDDYDSERDILIREELLDNYSHSFPVIESYHFDIPSFSRPLAKPPDGNTGILNIKMMGDNTEQKDNSSPRPPEEIVSDNSNADIESFSPSPIPNEDSDSHMEEIDLYFNPDDPMPPGIEEDDYDSERDISLKTTRCELKCKALADLGASINLMPLSVWKKLGLPELIPTRITLELANRTICTPAGIARDVFILVGKFTFLADFVIVDYESDPRVPLILGRPFLRIARALIDVHGEEMVLRNGDERLTLNMRHDTSNYSHQPQKESINLINVFNNSSEDFLEDLFPYQSSGNPTFSLHPELTSPKVNNDIIDSEGCNVLSEKLLDLDSTKDLYPPLHDNSLSGSTTYPLLEEFNKDSSLKDSIDQKNRARLVDVFIDSIPAMFTDEHTLDYSSLSIFDVYADDFLKVESDAEIFYNDPFDSKGEKIKESKLLIDELDLPCDFLPPFEYDSFISQDFSRVDALPSTNNEDKIFNPVFPEM
nr:reverse transcriptase domain-containing protein [Tanacetum cinerariifolium]